MSNAATAYREEQSKYSVLGVGFLAGLAGRNQKRPRPAGRLAAGVAGRNQKTRARRPARGGCLRAQSKTPVPGGGLAEGVAGRNQKRPCPAAGSRNASRRAQSKSQTRSKNGT